MRSGATRRGRSRNIPAITGVNRKNFDANAGTGEVIAARPIGSASANDKLSKPDSLSRRGGANDTSRCYTNGGTGRAIRPVNFKSCRSATVDVLVEVNSSDRPPHSEIGKVCFERATVPLEQRVAEFLKKGMRRGLLRKAQPLTAAIHLLSLLDAEFLQRMLFGVMNSPKPEAIHAAVRRAVDAFLSGYQPADRVRGARAQQRRGVPRNRGGHGLEID